MSHGRDPWVRLCPSAVVVDHIHACAYVEQIMIKKNNKKVRALLSIYKIIVDVFVTRGTRRARAWGNHRRNVRV